MLVSTIREKYGITSTALNEACVKERKVPIFMYSDYFIDAEAKVYIVKIINGDEIKFIPITPSTYRKKAGIPCYKLKNDRTGEIDEVRADKLYLYTTYGPMSDDSIYYVKNEWEYIKTHMKYHIFKSTRIDESTLKIDNVIFKIIPSEDPSIDPWYYISSAGVVYNLRTHSFMMHHFNHKLYHYVAIAYPDRKLCFIHRAVFTVWKNNGIWPNKDFPIDHIDGFKNHNWSDNLRLTSHLENFRSAAYEQSLRNTPWTYEIINYMCKLMEDPNTTGPKYIYDKIRDRYPEWTISYDACKRRIYELLEGHFWKDVSSKYNIETYRANVANHNNIAVNDELIHKICQIATNGVQYETNKQLAEENNLPIHIVNRVLRGEYRTDISSQYNIQYNTKKRRGFTEDEVHIICQDFMNGYAVNRIVERRGRNKCDIWKIIRREKYSEIGKQYNFESIRPDLNYAVPYNPN